MSAKTSKSATKPSNKEVNKVLKELTGTTDENLSLLPTKEKELLCGMHEKGVSKNIITGLLNRSIVREMIKKEIENENFKEEVIPHGRDKFVYHKFVQVDEYKSVVEQKSFNSERALRQWMKMKKIQGLI